MHSSVDWNEPSLVGDLDAHRASLIQCYWIDDLGFYNIVDWIDENKDKWENDLPLWYTHHWKQNLRKSIKAECYEDLLVESKTIFSFISNCNYTS